ncbi:MAG: phage terminase large subunit [Clostridia bacterium]|nr:phage terminase large subunit [Clostridia bacterium]
MKLHLEYTDRQEAFLTATADEVLYGGAAGGGKSYGQFLDTVAYAGRYKGSKQLILRRTFPELEKSIIRVFLSVLPKEKFKYNASKHTGVFNNGSVVDFGYIDNENDVFQYQSAEYDVIRFDELTHFTESMYTYLISRLRGATPFPRSAKSATNPGGIGHTWVKQRFIDPAPPNTLFKAYKKGRYTGTRIFLPAKVQDNDFLMASDPDYLRRLENLDDRDKKALLYGEWDLFDGQFFDNFNQEIHVVKPFFEKGKFPNDWEFYVTMDYGLDMLAAYVVGVAPGNKFYVVEEFYDGMDHPDKGHKGLIVSEAAAAIKKLREGYPIRRHFAPPDLWARSKDTGKSIAELFYENGVPLFRVDNNRVNGWMVLKEMLKPHTDEQGATVADLMIFDTCRHLIRTLPAVAVDDHNPNDVAKESHELTHAPDAIRYFFAGRPVGKAMPKPQPRYDFEFQRPKPDAGGRGEKIKPI